MISIFISYASEDYDKVKQLSNFLEHNNFSVWLDQDNILPGEKWKDSLERGLNQADFIIPCLSNHSVSKRGFVQREMRFALDKLDELFDDDIYLIPIKLGKCDIPDKLKNLQCTDFYSSNGKKTLLKALSIGAERRELEINLKNKKETIEEKVDLSNLGGGGFADLLGFIRKK